MFRIYNLQELRRLSDLLEDIEKREMAFPVDVFRDANVVSAMEYGVQDTRITRGWSECHTVPGMEMNPYQRRHLIKAEVDFGIIMKGSGESR